MKELELDELKVIELDILKKFDKICKENNLEYSLAYGTMIGAVRHKGFIPWDDDIDVYMKREDYERLLSLRYNDDNYEIKCYRYSDDYYYLYSKMIDKSTYLEESWRAEKNMGVYIDIFPIDYVNFSTDGEALENEKNALKKKVDKLFILSGLLGHKLSHHKGFNLRYITKLLFMLITLPFRRLILKKIDLMLADTVDGQYCIQNMDNNIFTSDVFDGITYCDFEDFKAPIYERYDEILKAEYGDYMTPPPIEQQKSVHWFKAYRKD